MPVSSHPYKVSTAALPRSALKSRPHPFDASARPDQLSLGDATGLTRIGLHLSHVAAGTTSAALHWHGADEEWVFVLEAAPGARLLVREHADDPAAETREEPLAKGDFVGFPAGSKMAHAMRAGEGELVYLTGGTRNEMDLCFYPEIQRTLVVERAPNGLKTFLVRDEHRVAT